MEKFSKITETLSGKMKLGLDVHGVIDSMPEFFSFLTKAIIKSGGEVHVITGGTTEDDLKFMKENDIQYTHYFSIIDHHKELETPTHGKHPKYGFDMISDEEWDKTKSEYCQREGISLHIDDTLAYNETFTTPFCRLWTHNNHPKPIHKDPRHLL